jgi:phage anti-repressor protein
MKNELGPVFTAEIGGIETQAVDARTFHQLLGNQRQVSAITREFQFADWIKRRIEKYGFVENQDYVKFPRKEGAPRSSRHNYTISVDMAKELLMVENNARGREVRKYFIECEQIALFQLYSSKKGNNYSPVATAAWGLNEVDSER